MQITRGFSLLELLMVVAILGILGAAGFGYYGNVAKNIEITTVARSLASDLRDARAKAMGGESQRKWGVHAVNGASGAPDYFEVFSTPTNYADGGTVVDRTQYLYSGAAFSDPSEGTNKDLIFTGISGTTTASSFTVTSQTQSVTVSITALGLIY